MSGKLQWEPGTYCKPTEMQVADVGRDRYSAVRVSPKRFYAKLNGVRLIGVGVQHSMEEAKARCEEHAIVGDSNGTLSTHRPPIAAMCIKMLQTVQ